MNKKQNIQIAVIVVAFGAAGFILYNGFFKNSSSAPNAAVNAAMDVGAGPSTSASKSGSEAILPAGTTLNFDILKTHGLNSQNISYPQLDPNGNIGIPENNLITMPPSKGQ